MKAFLLGEFRLVDSAGQPISQVKEKPRSLLALLCCLESTSQSRQQLAFSLWPDSRDSQARTNLRNLLFNLRQQIPHLEQLLDIRPSTIALRPEIAEGVDVVQFRAALAAARSATGDEQLLHLETAANL